MRASIATQTVDSRASPPRASSATISRLSIGSTGLPAPKRQPLRHRAGRAQAGEGARAAAEGDRVEIGQPAAAARQQREDRRDQPRRGLRAAGGVDARASRRAGTARCSWPRSRCRRPAARLMRASLWPRRQTACDHRLHELCVRARRALAALVAGLGAVPPPRPRAAARGRRRAGARQGAAARRWSVVVQEVGTRTHRASPGRADAAGQPGLADQAA